MYFLNTEYCNFSKLKKNNKIIIEFNKINIFFKLKATITAMRAMILMQLKIYKNTEKAKNWFFLMFRSFSVLNFIWLIEYGVLLFLIKIKLSNSLYNSIILIHKNIVQLNTNYNLNRWDYLLINLPSQLILNKKVLLTIKINIQKFYSLYHFFKKFSKIINSTKYIQSISLQNALPKKTLSWYYLKLFLYKYLEFDYKSLIFILLPINNWKYHYVFVYLTWLNYWNFKSLNWKYTI